MSETKNVGYFVRYYYLRNDGRLATQDFQLYSNDVCKLTIPEQCMYLEIYKVSGSGAQSEVVCENKYLIGKRFDRARSNFKNDAEKFSFVMQKVYRPHIELDERKIKNGKYVVESEGQGEA